MRARRELAMDETVRSGPGAVARDFARLSGAEFLQGEPYGGQVSEAQRLPDVGSLHQIVIDLPGSNLWVHLWFDDHHLLRHEVIVAEGHLIQRTFSYPPR